MTIPKAVSFGITTAFGIRIVPGFVTELQPVCALFPKIAPNFFKPESIFLFSTYIKILE